METKLKKIDNSLGITFPQEILDQLALKEGDKMNIIVTGDSIQIKPFEPHFETIMTAYKEGKAKYHNAMIELADG
ncbi:AbrB/MazE/SpoVT family DNA-binding domain-containing protein [Geminocystis sp. CENA526]|uniref:AbrB/MazE/SpoVT family DNA-binding domain-containing protein n=1 Tax=Geminocystis sp. CENA526 TaxID=1355871 RepID=UPI003D6F34C3